VITVERYRKTRFWAVYEHGELLCVTVYKKGANAVKQRIGMHHALANRPAHPHVVRDRAVGELT